MIKFLFDSFLIKYKEKKYEHSQKKLLYKFIEYARTHNYNLYLKDGKLFSNDISYNLDNEITFKFINEKINFISTKQKDHFLFKSMIAFLWNDKFYPKIIEKFENVFDFDEYDIFIKSLNDIYLKEEGECNWFFLNGINKKNVEKFYYYNLIWDGVPSNINAEILFNFDINNPLISDKFTNVFMRIAFFDNIPKAIIYKNNFNTIIHEVVLDGVKEENMEKIKNLIYGISLTKFAVEKMNLTYWHNFKSEHIEEIKTFINMVEY